MNTRDLRRWMKGRRRTSSLGARKRCTAYRRYTFARNDLLFTMSDNTRMQTARERDALHARICFHGRAAGESELIDRWWSQTESNRRPPACKAGALPTELWPRIAAPAKRELVGLGRFELPTSRLSSARSNQLSYRPKSQCTLIHPRIPKTAGESMLHRPWK